MRVLSTSQLEAGHANWTLQLLIDTTSASPRFSYF